MILNRHHTRPTLFRLWKRTSMLTLLTCLASLMQVQAQDMRTVWLSMPDTLTGFLNSKQRTDMLNVMDMDIHGDADNALSGKSSIKTLTENYMSVKMSESSILQIRKLPHEKDSLLCVAKTYLAPQKETTIGLYEASTWKKIGDVVFSIDELIHRPDTMPEDSFGILKKDLDPYFISATISESADELTVAASTSNTTVASSSIDAILTERKYKWDGNAFKPE